MEIALFLQGSKGVAVTSRATGAGRYIRQSGPPGRFGVTDIVVEPNSNEPLGCFLSWEVSEEQIPVIYIDAVISAIKEVLSEEGFVGDHLYGTRIRVVDGAYHETDSKLSCYFVATSQAFRQALREASLYANSNA